MSEMTERSRRRVGRHATEYTSRDGLGYRALHVLVYVYITKHLLSK